MTVDAERVRGRIENPGDDRVDLQRGETPDRIRKTDEISAALDAPGIHLDEERRVGS